MSDKVMGSFKGCNGVPTAKLIEQPLVVVREYLIRWKRKKTERSGLAKSASLKEFREYHQRSSTPGTVIYLTVICLVREASDFGT